MTFRLFAIVTLAALLSESCLSATSAALKCKGQKELFTDCAPLLYLFSISKHEGDVSFWTKRVLESFDEYKKSPKSCAGIKGGCGFKEFMTRGLEEG